MNYEGSLFAAPFLFLHLAVNCVLKSLWDCLPRRGGFVYPGLQNAPGVA